MSGSTDSLELRLLRVEAELALRRIIFDYSVHLDSGDYDAYVDLFAPDAEWTNAEGSHKGRAAIHKMLLDTVGPGSPLDLRGFHTNGNERIDVDADARRATAVSRYLFVMRGPDDRPRPSLAGMYHDEFVRLDEGWKISRRVAEEVIPTHEEWVRMAANR